MNTEVVHTLGKDGDDESNTAFRAPGVLIYSDLLC